MKYSFREIFIVLIHRPLDPGTQNFNSKLRNKIVLAEDSNIQASNTIVRSCQRKRETSTKVCKFTFCRKGNLRGAELVFFIPLFHGDYLVFHLAPRRSGETRRVLASFRTKRWHVLRRPCPAKKEETEVEEADCPSRANWSLTEDVWTGEDGERRGRKRIARRPILRRRYLSRATAPAALTVSRKTKKRTSRRTEKRPAIDITNVTGAPSTLLRHRTIKRKEKRARAPVRLVVRIAAAR